MRKSLFPLPDRDRIAQREVARDRELRKAGRTLHAMLEPKAASGLSARLARVPGIRASAQEPRKVEIGLVDDAVAEGDGVT